MLEPVALSLALAAALVASEPIVERPLQPPGAQAGAQPGAQPGAVAPAEATPPASLTHFLDGGRPRAVVVSGPARDHVRESARTPVQVHELDTGRVWPAYVGGAAVVKVRERERPEAAKERLSQLGEVRPLMPTRGLFLVEDAAGDALALTRRLQPLVGELLEEAVPDLAIPVRLHEMPIPPNDPRYPGQWYLKNIGIEDAWAYSTGSSDITVVVADNGCDLDHPDLVDKLDPGIDVVDKDGSPDHQPGVMGNEHGTACAGIIGASSNNDIGIAGACPSCRLRCARLLSLTDEPVSLSDLVEVFQFALDVDADVVSNSWGFVNAIAAPRVLADAITGFYLEGRGGKGGIVVFAAGNDARELGDDDLLAHPGIIGVGAITNFDDLTSFSNYGASLDLVAPTGSVTTDIAGPDGADPGDYTNQFGGTSSACPVVAGVAALVLSAAPELTADELATLLVESTRPAPFAEPDERGHDPHFGYGIVDPAAALRQALGIEVHDDAGPKAEPDPPTGCGCAAGSLAPTLGLLPLLALLSRRRARAAAAR